MTIFKNLEEAIEAGEFESFIEEKLSIDKEFLQRRFLYKEGKQITVLNYLIYNHDERPGKANMEGYIKSLLIRGADFNTDCSIHLLARLKKFNLLSLFLEASQKIEFNSYDSQGQTILSWVIDSKNSKALESFLKSGCLIDINKPNRIHLAGQNIEVQPLHQAAAKDAPEAIYYLLEKGAVIDNRCGSLQETPLLLATRLGRIKALKGLLFSARDYLDLEATNDESYRPIDLLCNRLATKKKPEEALYGIAMLLCHGAKAPRDKKFRDLLMKNRFALIEQVKEYAKEGNSAVKFVRACHDENNPLHDIIYANDWPHRIWRYSSLQWIWHLLGFSCDEAFLIESLVFDPGAPHSKEEFPLLNSVATISLGLGRGQRHQKNEELIVNKGNPAKFTPDELTFAQFVWRYSSSCGLFKAPWSTMYRNLTLGDCTTMDKVREYSEREENKTTTTRILMNAIDKNIPKIHEDFYQEGSPSTF